MSRDAGVTWSLVGPSPDGIIDLAGSAKDENRLYAATQSGLKLSEDGGQSWSTLRSGAATMVSVEASRVYAFLPDKGLVSADESDLRFDAISPTPPAFIVLHLAVDDRAPNRMFAATAEGRVLRSTDAGQTWNEP